MSDTTIILAAVCGIVGILAAFMPFVGVLTSFISKDKNSHDDSSIWMFLVWAMVAQFIVSVMFYWVLMIFDALIKTNNLKILGANGAFELFWKVPVIDSTPTLQAWTVLIVMIREMLIMINAFMPAAVIIGASLVGYLIADKQQHRGGNGGNIDFGAYGIKMFLAVAIASVTYFGWARMASYALQMPRNGGEITTLDRAAQAWWRESLGIQRNGASGLY